MDINETMDFEKIIKNQNSTLVKIINVLEKTTSPEVIKTTCDSLINIIIEEPFYFLLFLKQVLVNCNSGKIKMIKEFKYIFDQLFKETDDITFFTQLLSKLGSRMFDCLVIPEKTELTNLKNSNETSDFKEHKEIEKNVICIDAEMRLKHLSSLSLLESSAIASLNVDEIQKLYNPKNENQSNLLISEFVDFVNVRILCGNDISLQKEFMESTKNEISTNSNNNKNNNNGMIEETGDGLNSNKNNSKDKENKDDSSFENSDVEFENDNNKGNSNISRFAYNNNTNNNINDNNFNNISSTANTETDFTKATKKKHNTNYTNDTSSNEKENNLKSIHDFYNDNKHHYSLINLNNLTSNISKKTISNNNRNNINDKNTSSKIGISKYYTFHYLPLINFISDLLTLNHSKLWEVRICSITILNIFLKNERLINGYQVSVSFQTNNHLFYCLDSLYLSNRSVFLETFNEKLSLNKYKESILVKLVINAILDMVIDFSETKNICILKDSNNTTAMKLFKSITDVSLKEKIIKNILIQFSILLKNKNSNWQHLHSILLFLKYLEDYSQIYLINVAFQLGFLKNYPEILKREEQEVISVSNHIILGIFQEFNFELVEKNELIAEVVRKVASCFLSCADNFDDIEYSIQAYLEALLKLIEYGVFKLDDEVELSKLNKFCEDNLNKFALNQMTKVRQTFYLVISKLIIFIETRNYRVNSNTESSNINETDKEGGIKQADKPILIFSNEFLKNVLILAYQSLSLEENKEVINSIMYFCKIVLIDFPNYSNSFVLYFSKNAKNFLKILGYDNVKTLKHYYLPDYNPIYETNPASFYNSFIINDAQTHQVILKKQKRQLNLYVFLSDLVIACKDIMLVILKSFNVEFDRLLISSNLYHAIVIYSYYLQRVENNSNITLFIQRDCLIPYLSYIEPNGLSDIKIILEKFEDIELKKRLEAIQHLFFDISSNNNIDNDRNSIKKNIKESYKSLMFLLANSQFETKIANKLVFELKIFSNDLNVKILIEKINSIIKKYDQLKTPLRAYLAHIVYMTNLYTETSIEKKTNYINSYFNILKSNTEFSNHFMKTFIQLILSSDKKDKIIIDFTKNCINAFIDELKSILTQHSNESGKTNNGITDANNRLIITYNSLYGNNNNNNQITGFESLLNKKFLPLSYLIETALVNNLFDVISDILIAFFENNSTSNKNKIILMFLLISNNYHIRFLKYHQHLYPIFSSIFDLKNNGFDDEFDLYLYILELVLSNITNLFELSSLSCIVDDLFYMVNKSNFNGAKIFELLSSLFDKAPLIQSYFIENSNTAYNFFIYCKENKEKPIVNDNNNNINSNPNTTSSKESDKSLESVNNTITNKQNSFNKYTNTNTNNDINKIKKIQFSYKMLIISKIIDIIKLLNNSLFVIRTSALKFFSKVMKTISELKLNESYQELEANNVYLKGFFSNSFKSAFNLPFKLTENLRTYQLNGIRWLCFLGNLNLSGCLCDDMGLGKTIQTLCCLLIESLVLKNSKKKLIVSLVVCPNTLVLNWIKEHNKFFFPSHNFNIVKIDNLKQIKDSFSSVSLTTLSPKPILFITSYDRFKDPNEIEHIKEVNFFYLVLDEAHLVKNHKSKIYSNLKQINSDRKIVLTGTPIQNNIMELWSIFDLIMPGFLGTKSEFDSKYNKKIQTNLKKLNLEEKLHDDLFQASISEIKKWVKPFILRRIKSDVLKELPEKQIDDYICEMENIQKKLYKLYYNAMINKVDEKKKKKKDTKETKDTKDSKETINTKDFKEDILDIYNLSKNGKKYIKYNI